MVQNAVLEDLLRVIVSLESKIPSSPQGCTITRAMTGVMAMLGYLGEKKRFVAEPRSAHSRERTHMRGASQ